MATLSDLGYAQSLQPGQTQLPGGRIVGAGVANSTPGAQPAATGGYTQSPSNYYSSAQPATANAPTAATYPTPAAVSPYQSAQTGQAAWAAITAQNAQSAQNAQKARDAYGNTLMNNYDVAMNANYGSATLPGGRHNVPISGVGKDWPELKTLVNSMTAYDAANAPAPTTGAQRAAAVNAQPSSQFTTATQMRDYSNSQAALTGGMNVNELLAGFGRYIG